MSGPCAEVLRDAQRRLSLYDHGGYTVLHGSTAVPADPPALDELKVESWRQDERDLCAVSARAVVLVYVEGRFADEVLHPTTAFWRAVRARELSFRSVLTRYCGWH